MIMMGLLSVFTLIRGSFYWEFLIQLDSKFALTDLILKLNVILVTFLKTVFILFKLF